MDVETWKKSQIIQASAVLDYNSELYGVGSMDSIHYVGGLDISFSPSNDSCACVCLVVYDTKQKSIVYKHSSLHTVDIPYIPTYLGFREIDPYMNEIHHLIEHAPELKPQILLVDGNGRLHPRLFGSACMVGIQSCIPTIGVAKNVLCGPCFNDTEAVVAFHEIPFSDSFSDEFPRIQLVCSLKEIIQRIREELDKGNRTVLLCCGSHVLGI